MKFLAVLGLLCLCFVGAMAAVPPSAQPANTAVAATLPPPPTLAQDLKELFTMLPMLPLSELTTRYLLNDEQFQSFVRIINSLDAYSLQMTFRSQPEFITFMSWVRQQIALSGKFKIKFDEAEEMMSLFNRLPYWANTVYGWQGFVNEFQMYYPEAMIQSHINMKVAQNGIFTQFIQRLRALKPVYDRVVAMPEAQRVIAAMQAKGINTAQLDTFIRNQFGWQVPVITGPGAPVQPGAPAAVGAI